MRNKMYDKTSKKMRNKIAYILDYYNNIKAIIMDFFIYDKTHNEINKKTKNNKTCISIQ